MFHFDIISCFYGFYGFNFCIFYFFSILFFLLSAGSAVGGTNDNFHSALILVML